MSIDADHAPVRTRQTPARLWAFLPFVALTVVHVSALAVGDPTVAAPTKLGLMPLLALGVVLSAWGMRWGAPLVLLVVAIAFSWLGDGAATFFPFADELAMMLTCFGLAHVCYIVLFTKYLARGRLPLWAAVYVVWWVALLVILAPSVLAGDDGIVWLVAIGAYGILLGFTAASAARATPAVALGGALFLTSDSILAFRIFTPDAVPDWTSPAVMITYCAGQGLIAAGAVVLLRAKAAR
ncbi:lysoplasmalogenase family protein [Microbacterium sp. GXF7504]